MNISRTAMRALSLATAVAATLSACSPRDAATQLERAATSGCDELKSAAQHVVADDPTAAALAVPYLLECDAHDQAVGLISTVDDALATSICDAAVSAVDPAHDHATFASHLHACASVTSPNLVLARTVSDWEGAESAPDDASLLALVETATGADLIQAWGESIARSRAEAASGTDENRVAWLRAGYALSRSDELRAEIVSIYLDLGDAALAADDPHLATTLYEHVSLHRVPGLDAAPEDVERANAGIRRALFPVYVESFRARYLRKHMEDDVELGITEQGESFEFAPVPSLDERVAAMRDWVYRVTERPRPTPAADFTALIEPCADPSQTCSITLEQLVEWSYEMDEIELAYAEQIGEELVYP